VRRLAWLILFALFSLLPQTAAAHDDPIVTVRVLCNGFNVLDMDAVLGELSDSATLKVDRTISGSEQIRAWVKEQMDADLRIEIVDIETPQRLADGYTLKWTARFSRQDWRKAGTPSRDASNSVVIHNGRITEWTTVLDAAAQPRDALAAPSVVTASPPGDSGFPEFFGIPVTLLLAAFVAVAGGSLLVRSAMRR
jgi:hypothetical protein